MSSKKIAENLQATYIKKYEKLFWQICQAVSTRTLAATPDYLWLCSLVPTWWEKRAPKIVHYLYSYAVIQTHIEEKKKNQPT